MDEVKNIGMFVSFDPLALDQACVDACLAAMSLPGCQPAKNLVSPALRTIMTILPIPRLSLNGVPAWDMLKNRIGQPDL